MHFRDLPNGHHMVGLPSVTSWGPGRLDFLVTGDDGIVYYRHHDKGRFSPPKGWEDYPALPDGHRVVGAFSVTSWGPGRLDFLVTGDDGIVYHRYYDLTFNPDTGYGPPDGWEAYPRCQAAIALWGRRGWCRGGLSGPDFLVTGDDGIVLSPLSRHGQLWPARWLGGIPALPGGHRVVGPPNIASWGPGRLDFLVTGDDGIVYHRYHDMGRYGPPEEWEAYPALPGGPSRCGAASITSWGHGRLDFLVTGDAVRLSPRSRQGSYGPPDAWEAYPAAAGRPSRRGAAEGGLGWVRRSQILRHGRRWACSSSLLVVLRL